MPSRRTLSSRGWRKWRERQRTKKNIYLEIRVSSTIYDDILNNHTTIIINFFCHISASGQQHSQAFFFLLLGLKVRIRYMELGRAIYPNPSFYFNLFEYQFYNNVLVVKHSPSSLSFCDCLTCVSAYAYLRYHLYQLATILPYASAYQF